jgi:Domain of unknown function (DUF6471)
MSYTPSYLRESQVVGMPAKEKEYADRVRRFLKAELKRADVSYKELAERLTKHGLEETEVGISSKLARGTFSATFLLACLAVLEVEAARLADL